MAGGTATSSARASWGGSADQHCGQCRCRKYHDRTPLGEVWMFDWCYHETGTSEAVRFLASTLYMFCEPEAARA